MSAQKREETIARFSVPLEEGAEPEQASSTQVSSTRRRPRASQRTINDDADVSVAVADDDFVPGDDDDFVESDDDTAFTNKKKGKGKAKQRKTSSTRVFSGVNPKVMLISLKAVSLSIFNHHIFADFFVQGALGLNLTGLLQPHKLLSFY